MVRASVVWPSVIWNCEEWVGRWQGIEKDRLVSGSAFLKLPLETGRGAVGGGGASQDRGLVESVSSKVYSDQESYLVHVTSFIFT